MARKKKSELDGVVVEPDDIPDAGALEAVGADLEEAAAAAAPRVPTPVDADWNDYVLSHFARGEVDGEGNPTADGLRRVVEAVLGPIVSSVARVVETPSESNGYRAVVETTVQIAFGGDRSDVRTFGSAADVYPGNTDEAYARFAVATAETRAEGRAYRKALKLRKVASEEKTSVPVERSGLVARSTPQQVKAIEKVCRDLGIDPEKLLAMGQKGYGSFAEMTYEEALAALGYMNKFLRDADSIPRAILARKADA